MYKSQPMGPNISDKKSVGMITVTCTNVDAPRSTLSSVIYLPTNASYTK